MQKLALMSGSIMAFLAVAIGAFGAHGLQSIIEANDRVDTFETAVKYHMYHALALLLTGLLLQFYPGRLMENSVWLFIAGIFIFSGSLYTLSITNIRILGAITPIGGLCFLIAWAMLAISFWKS
ncbi:MAG: DUF423 domain-containing protein [Cyclobacteriaceae bacterium]